MKTFHLGAGLLALVAGSALSTTADARPFYAKVSVGETTNTDVSGFSLSDGDAYGVAVGSTLGPLRVEAGVDRLEASVNLGQTITANALDYHATGYFDLPVGDKASVFAGAGVDYVDAEANFFGSSLNADGQGWHYALGGAYRLNDRMIGEVQFRHIEADMSSDYGDFDLAADEISVGLRLAL